MNNNEFDFVIAQTLKPISDEYPYRLAVKTGILQGNLAYAKKTLIEVKKEDKFNMKHDIYKVNFEKIK
jgi:hypothetical protein